VFFSLLIVLAMLHQGSLKRVTHCLLHRGGYKPKC